MTKKKPNPEKFIITAQIEGMKNIEGIQLEEVDIIVRVCEAVQYSLENAGYDQFNDPVFRDEGRTILEVTAVTNDEPKDEVHVYIDMEAERISLEFGNFEEEGGYSRFRAIWVSKVFYNTIGKDLCGYRRKVIKFILNGEDIIPANIDYLDRHVGKGFREIYEDFVENDIDL